MLFVESAQVKQILEALSGDDLMAFHACVSELPTMVRDVLSARLNTATILAEKPEKPKRGRKKRSRRKLSAAARKRTSIMMKKRWREYRKAKAKK